MSGRPIVGAVRGGPGSHYTRRAALEKSIALGAPLYLLVTVPAAAYDPRHRGEQRAIRAELAWRELALARANAAQLGHPDAQFNIQVRIGELADTVVDFVAEVDAGTVLLGRPRPALDAALNDGDLGELVARLRAATGVEVVVVEPA